MQIRTLQKAPRDPEKLRKILKEKQEEYEKATDSDDIERHRKTSSIAQNGEHILH